MTAEREARREAQRGEKEEKKAVREAARLRNSLRCDERPHVRIAASVALYGSLETTAAATTTATTLTATTATITATTATATAATTAATATKANNYQQRKPAATTAAATAATAAATAEGGTASAEEGDVDGTQPLGPAAVSLCGLSLRDFALELLPTRSWSSLTSLDLSHNELAELPGLESLVSLTELDLCRNWFRVLPVSLRQLPKLAKLNASRNFLRPVAEFLVLLLQAPGLPSLQELDITFNVKIYTQALADLLATELPSVAVRITVTSPPPPGAFVGRAACDRDASLLRSQLEPYTTLALRRRLVSTFGQEAYSMFGAPPEGRAEVMTQLLECYAKTGERRLVRVNGTPVAPELLSELHAELREWSQRNKQLQERPYIHAETYMILRSPAEFSKKVAIGSSNACLAKKKFEQNSRLWELAAAAMVTVDPEFAAKFTGLAVTEGFRGSPHIDTTNTGPFYGLAFGDFAEGTGGIQVELNPMTVAEVNTKNRLGKLDGRFPHWVAPYGEHCERFSLIYYQTEGEVTPSTTAVFGTVLDGAATASIQQRVVAGFEAGRAIATPSSCFCFSALWTKCPRSS